MLSVVVAGVAELFEEGAFVVGEVGGEGDFGAGEEVAASVFAFEAGHALTTEAEEFAGLGFGWDGHGDATGWCGDDDFAAEDGGVERDFDFGAEVVAGAFESLVGLDGNAEVDVAIGTATLTSTALPGDTDAGTGGDTCRNFDFDGLGLGNHPGAVAGRADCAASHAGFIFKLMKPGPAMVGVSQMSDTSSLDTISAAMSRGGLPSTFCKGMAQFAW